MGEKKSTETERKGAGWEKGKIKLYDKLVYEMIYHINSLVCVYLHLCIMCIWTFQAKQLMELDEAFGLEDIVKEEFKGNQKVS